VRLHRANQKLFSQNENIVTTCKLFHNLGLRTSRSLIDHAAARSTIRPPPDLIDAVTLHAIWKEWARAEELNRILLGLHILDGQFSCFCGFDPSVRHLSTRLLSACDDALYMAPTAEEWADLMRARGPVTLLPLANVYDRLFEPSPPPSSPTPVVPPEFPVLSHYVVLEGLAATAAEIRSTNGRYVVGVPRYDDVTRALLRWQSIYSDPQDNLQLIIRWHAIWITLDVDVRLLETTFDSLPRGCTNKRAEEVVLVSQYFQDFSSTPAARRALLHACAILRLSEDMSYRRACPFHVPACVFDAALVMNAYTLGRPRHSPASSSSSSPPAGTIDLYDDIDWASIHGSTHVGESAPTRFVRDGSKTPTISGVPIESPFHLGPFITLLSSIGGIWGRAKTFADKMSMWPTAL
jgi:hypothetical protein